MTKIIIPVDSAKNGGNLYTLVDDLSNLNSEVSKTRDNGNLIIDDDTASAEQKLEIDAATLLSILQEGGQVQEYLMAVRAPNALAMQDVPAGVPYRTNVLGQTRIFLNWFLDGAEVWTENAGNEFIFYTNPAPSLGAQGLTASEIEIIRQLDVANITVLTVAQAQAVVASGWNKVVW